MTHGNFDASLRVFESVVKKAVDLAKPYCKIAPKITARFSWRMTVAMGLATTYTKSKGNRVVHAEADISLSAPLWFNYPAYARYATMIHEIAHVYDDIFLVNQSLKHGRGGCIKGRPHHGDSWKAWVGYFAKMFDCPEATDVYYDHADIDWENVRDKNGNRLYFYVTCPCKNRMKVTKRQADGIRKGVRWRCSHCRTPLIPEDLHHAPTY